MAITLPEELRGLLSELGFEFPTADEDRIAELGSAWTELGFDLASQSVQTNVNAALAWSENTGKDIDAFKAWWTGEGNSPQTLPDGSQAALMTGFALNIAAKIVIALKLYIIGELVATTYAIAAAVAAAVETGGLGAVAILAIKQLAKEVIGAAIDEAVTRILEG